MTLNHAEIATDWDAFFAIPAHRYLTATQVAHCTGRARSTAHLAAASRGIRLPGMGTREITASRYDWSTFFADPAHHGLNVREVMALTGRAFSTVHTAARRAGVRLCNPYGSKASHPVAEPMQLPSYGDSTHCAADLTPQQRMRLTSGELTSGELAVIRRHRPHIARELHL